MRRLSCAAALVTSLALVAPASAATVKRGSPSPATLKGKATTIMFFHPL